MKKTKLSNLYLKMNKTGLDLMVKTKDVRIFTFKDCGYIVARDFAYQIPEYHFFISCTAVENNVIPSLCGIDEFDEMNIIQKYHYVYDEKTPLLYVNNRDLRFYGEKYYYYLDISKFRKYFGNENQYTLINCGYFVKVLYFKDCYITKEHLTQNVCIGIMMLRRYKEKLS